MFGLSFGELLIIAVLALLLLGPERLPEAAKTFGKGLRELRRATDDLKDQVEREIYTEDRKIAKPSLVPPVPAAAPSEPGAPPPAATADNVPGLEAALADAPAPAAAAPLAPAPAPAAPVTATAAAVAEAQPAPAPPLGPSPAAGEPSREA